jgi:hypothetical protein
LIFRRRLVTAVLLALALSGPGLAAVQPSKTVATISKGDYRVVLRASKTSGGASPTAWVSVQASIRHGQEWKSTRTTLLTETYFWKVVTAAHAVCHLKLAAGATPKVTVSLLITPSIGCARTVTVPLTGK